MVLGAGGFLGGHIAAAFAAEGARVHAVRRPAARGAARRPLPGTEVVAPGLLELSPRQLARLIDASGADTVVNAAGRAWQADEDAMTAGNATLVHRLIEALALLLRPPRLIQLGTVHEYGAGTPGAATTEEQPPAPLTPYGRTKLLGTEAVLRAAEDRGVDGVVLRLVNVLGPGVSRASLFGSVAARLGEAARIRAAGGVPDGLRLPCLRVHRDLVDVRDAVDAVRAAALAPGPWRAGRVINIGCGRAVPVRSLIDRMVTLSGVRLPVVEAVASVTAGGPPRTDTAWLQLDITRAREQLGWQPRRSLDDSLRALLTAELPATAGAATAPMTATAAATATGAAIATAERTPR
jgi:dTDP-6-deoxy-L-talose 4-dehydrogenase [NAD(P)+]